MKVLLFARLEWTMVADAKVALEPRYNNSEVRALLVGQEVRGYDAFKRPRMS
jgi:hypothetical protein